MFVHLETRSGFSLKEGTFTPEALARRAARLGMGAVALTDRDSLLGAARFVAACGREGIQPILGASLTVRDADDRRGSLVLLAADETGYANLCSLVTAAHHDRRRTPAASTEALGERAGGLIAIAGPASVPGALAVAGRADAARAAAAPLREAFGGRFHVGVQHRMEPGSAAEVRAMLGLARALDAPAVATNPVRYLTAADAPMADVMDAMRGLTGLDATGRINAEGHLKSPAAMRTLFAERPDLTERSVRIAEICSFELDLVTRRLPHTHHPDPHARLAERCEEGITRSRMARTQELDRRLATELAMIRELGYAGFFLLVAQIAEDIRAMGIRCAARGSATSSLVCRLLGISEVDPVRHDLAFERFLNPRRSETELPDIDLDVESARRQDAVSMILDRFGPDEAACVAMVDTYRARSAIRETGKALGLPEGEVGRLATAFPHIPARGIPRALAELPELAGLRLPGPQAAALLRIAARLDGLPRHVALHPCGIVLTPGDLRARVPAEPSATGHRMIQADKDDVEALGWIKLDVLGVRMLSAMRHALDEIARTTGTKVVLEEIPLDDEATFELIRASDTIGVFQIESPGQRELLQKLQPTSWEDLIVDISLFRPGPVKSDMVAPYLRRRAGMERPVYAHPDLRPVLRETFGVIVYHEQVMRVLMAIAGWDAADADHVRRHLDDEEKLPKFRAGFMAGAAVRGVAPDAAERIWDAVTQFASFGFCKAHAAAFAVPTYQSAWLKAHHPAHLVAGLLTHDPGMYPQRMILADARRRGIPILGPDVTRSEAEHVVEPVGEDFGVRLGLQDVAGITGAQIEAIVRAREERAFSGPADFFERTRVARPVGEALARAGALAGLPGAGNRRTSWVRAAARAPSPAGSVQLPLPAGPEPEDLLGLADLDPEEAVAAEIRTLGMETTGHVLDPFRPMLTELGAIPAAELARHRGGERLIVAGAKVASQTPAIRSGERIVFLTLEDGTGPVEVTVMPAVQREVIGRVFGHHLLAVGGTLRRTGVAGVSVLAEQVWDLRALRRARDRGGRTALAEALRHPGTGTGGEEDAARRLWHASPGSAG